LNLFSKTLARGLARGVFWFSLIIAVLLVQTNWSYFLGVGPEIAAKFDALIYMLSSNQFFMSILGINFMLTLVAIGFYSTNNRLVRLQNNYLEINGYTSCSEKSLNNFTYENYNDALIGLASTRAKHAVDLLGIAALTFIAIPAAPAIFSTYELALHGLKVSWVVSLPHLVLQNVGLLSMSKKDFNITPSEISKENLAQKSVIFVLPTSGKNIDTVKQSANSVLNWSQLVKNMYGLACHLEQWVVCEEKDHLQQTDRYKQIERHGSRIIVVPANYSTSNNTPYKARALQYTLELMKNEGLVGSSTWIYHQDDETMVGEDTILGVMDYVSAARPDNLYAVGIILYPNSWKGTPVRAQECSRSYDDLRLIYTTKTRGLLAFGHHGSHLLVRSDVEYGIGWDFGNVKAEDWIFGLMLWQKHRPNGSVLKGFAYEKPPFTASDLLKQRRRWLVGAGQVVFRKDIKLRYRLTALYGILSWLSALPSLLAFTLSIAHPTGGLFQWSGFITGFTWFSMYKYVSNGYSLNRRYIELEGGGFGPRLHLAASIAVGLFLDSLSPWYALFSRSKGFEVIKKEE